MRPAFLLPVSMLVLLTASPFLLLPAHAQVIDGGGEPPKTETPKTPTPEEQLNTALNKNDWAAAKTIIEANPKLLQGGGNRYNSGASLLSRAIQSGKADMVTFLLDKGVDPNQDYGTSALNSAITLYNDNWKDIATILVAKGANVNRSDGEGTPLTRVISYGSNNARERIEWLLSKGADPTLRSRNGQSPIEAALNNSNSEVLRLLLGKVDAKTRNDDGATLLHQVIGRGNLDIVRLLLEKGVDVNAQNIAGDTALHLMAANPSTELLKTLLDAGANPNLKNTRGDLPLHIALRRPGIVPTPYASNPTYYNGDSNPAAPTEPVTPRGTMLAPLTDKTDINQRDRLGLSPLLLALEARDQETRDLIMERAPKLDSTTQLFDAAASGNLAALETLLKAKPFLVYFRLADGTTPLHVSALWGTLGVAQALVKAGADVNARDARGETPLYEALTRPTGLYLRRSKNMMTFLLSKNADVNTSDVTDRTPLFRATGNGELDMITPLLEKGANPNIKDSAGQTPLMLTVGRSGSLPITQALLTKGANPNLRDRNNRTPLSLAIVGRRLDIIKLLFEKGATIDAGTGRRSMDSDGRGVLGQLIESNGGGNDDSTRDIFALLLEKGADPNEKTYGESIATRLISNNRTGSKEMLQMLLATKKVPLTATADRQSLLMTAINYGRRDAVEVLLDAGADANEKDANGKSALAIARSRNATDIVTLLTAKGAKE